MLSSLSSDDRAVVARIVDTAAPLTVAQTARLAVILRPSVAVAR